MVELLVLEAVLWSGVVVVAPVVLAAGRSARSMVVPVCEVELWSLLPAEGAAEPGTWVLAKPLPTVLEDVSLVTGGVEPGVEAWLPLLLIAELLEAPGAEPFGEAAAAPVALWSGVVELGLLLAPVALAEPLPQESEIMLTELTFKVVLSLWVPFTST